MPPERDRWYLPDIPDDSYATWEREKFQTHVTATAELQQFDEDTEKKFDSVPMPALWAEETAPIPAYQPPPRYAPQPVESQRFYEENSAQPMAGPTPLPAEEVASDPWSPTPSSGAAPTPELSPGERFAQGASERIGGFFSDLGKQFTPRDPLVTRELPEFESYEGEISGRYVVPPSTTMPQVDDEYEDNPWKPRETSRERFERQSAAGNIVGAHLDKLGADILDSGPIGGGRDILRAETEKIARENPNVYGDPDSREQGTVYTDPSTLAMLERIPPEERQQAIHMLRQVGAIPKNAVVPSDFDRDPKYRSLRVIAPNLSDDKLLEQAQQAATRWESQRENNAARGITYATAPPKDSASFAASPIELVEKEAEGAFKSERHLTPEELDAGFTDFTTDPGRAFSERSEYMERNQAKRVREQENLALSLVSAGAAGIAGRAAKGTTGLTRVALKGAQYATDPTEAIFDIPQAIKRAPTTSASGAMGGATGAASNEDEETQAQDTGLGTAIGIVAPKVARRLRVQPKEWNPRLVETINGGSGGDPNAPPGVAGLTVTDEGLEVDLVRYQKPEQAGEVSTRSGVFYTPANRDSGYRVLESADDPGGSQQITGKTLFVNPYIHKDHNVETYPESAGRRDISDHAYTIGNARFAGSGLRDDAEFRPLVEQFFRQHEIPRDEQLIDNLVKHQKTRLEVTTSLIEAWTAKELRGQGYDGVVTLNPIEQGSRPGQTYYRVGEVMDLRERTYPRADGSSELHAQFAPERELVGAGQRAAMGGVAGAMFEEDEEQGDLQNELLGMAIGAAGGKPGKGRKIPPQASKILREGGQHGQLERGPLVIKQSDDVQVEHADPNDWDLGEGADKTDITAARKSAAAHLKYYEEQGANVEDARSSFEEFESVRRADYDSAEEFQSARGDQWGTFLDDLGYVEEEIIEVERKRPDPGNEYFIQYTGKGTGESDSITVGTAAEAREIAERAIREEDWIDDVYVFPTIKDDDGFHMADSDADPVFAWKRGQNPIPPEPKEAPPRKNTKAEKAQFAREEREAAARDPGFEREVDEAYAALDAPSPGVADAPPAAAVDTPSPTAAENSPRPPSAEQLPRTPQNQKRLDTAWKTLAANVNTHEVTELRNEIRAFEEALDSGSHAFIESSWADVEKAVANVPKLGTPRAAEIQTQAASDAELLADIRATRAAAVPPAEVPAPSGVTAEGNADAPFPLDTLHTVPSGNPTFDIRSHPSGLEVRHVEGSGNWVVFTQRKNPRAGEEGQGLWLPAGTTKFDHPPTQGEMTDLIEKQVQMNDPEEAAKAVARAEAIRAEQTATKAGRDTATTTSGGRPVSQRPKFAGSQSRAEAAAEPETVAPTPESEPDTPLDPASPREARSTRWARERENRKVDVPYSVVRPFGAVADWKPGMLEAMQRVADGRPMEIGDDFLMDQVYALLERQPEAVRHLAEQIQKLMPTGSELAMQMGTLKTMMLLETARNVGNLSQSEQLRAALMAADLPTTFFSDAAANLGSQIGRAMRMLRQGAVGSEALEVSHRWDAFADVLDTEVVRLKDIAVKVQRGDDLSADDLASVKNIVGTLEAQHAKNGLLSDEGKDLEDLIHGGIASEEDGIVAQQLLQVREGKRGNKEIPSFGIRLQYLDEEIARARAAGDEGVASELQKVYDETMAMARERAVEAMTSTRKRADLWNTLSDAEKDTQIERRVRAMLGRDHTALAKAEAKASMTEDKVVLAAREEVRTRVNAAVEQERVNTLAARAEGIMALVRKYPNDPIHRETFDTLIGEMESFSNRGKLVADKLQKALESKLLKDAENLRIFNEKKLVREAIAATVADARKLIGQVVQGKGGAMDAFEQKLKALETNKDAAKRVPTLRKELNNRLDAKAASKLKAELRKDLNATESYKKRIERQMAMADKQQKLEPLQTAARHAMEDLRKNAADMEAHQAFEDATWLIRQIDPKMADDFETRLDASLFRISSYKSGSEAIRLLERSPSDQGARVSFYRAVNALDVDHPKLATLLRERLTKAIDRYQTKQFNISDRREVKGLLDDARTVADNLLQTKYPEGSGKVLDDLITKLQQQSARGHTAGEKLRERLLRTGLFNAIDTSKFKGGVRDRDDDFVTDMIKRLGAVNPNDPASIMQFARELREPRFADWIREGGVVSMLSNPQTTWILGVNNAANVTNTVMRFGLKYALMAGIDAGWSAVRPLLSMPGSPKRHERVLHMSSVRAGWKAGRDLQTMKKGWDAGVSIMKTGRHDDAVMDAARIGDLSRVHREHLTEKFGHAGALMHFVSTRPLLAQDVMLGSIIETMETAIQMNELSIKTGKTPEQLRLAMGSREYLDILMKSKQAKDYTLVKRRYNTPTRTLFSFLSKRDRRDPIRQAGEMIAFHFMPFSTVAENTVKQGMYDYGWMGVPGQLLEIGTGKRLTGEALDDLGKLDLASNIVIGASFATLGVILASQDLIAPSGVIDQKERQNWAPGKKPGHIKMPFPGSDNDHWVDIRGLPFAMPLLQAANYHEAMTKFERELQAKDMFLHTHPHEYGFATWKAMLLSAFVTLDSHPMLGVSTDIAKYVRGDAPKETSFAREIMRYLPMEGLMRWTAGLGDIYEREKKTFSDALLYSVPSTIVTDNPITGNWSRESLPVKRGQLSGPLQNDMSPAVDFKSPADIPGAAARLVTQFPKRSVDEDSDLLQLYRLLEVPSPNLPKEYQGVTLETKEALDLHDLRAEFLNENEDAIFDSITNTPTKTMKKQILASWTAQATQYGAALMTERHPTFWDRFQKKVGKDYGG